MLVEWIYTSRRWWARQQYVLVVIKNMPSPKRCMFKNPQYLCALLIRFKAPERLSHFQAFAQCNLGCWWLIKSSLSEKPALWVAHSDCFDSALYLARSFFLCTNTFSYQSLFVSSDLVQNTRGWLVPGLCSINLQINQELIESESLLDCSVASK